jgi:outer membrane murein-binding lipoprotein Lpp
MKTSNQNQFPYTMKSRYTSLLIASALTSVVLIGCGEEDKAAKLAGLKKQQSELTKQITELEKELAGTTKTEVKTKEVAALARKNANVRSLCENTRIGRSRR